MCARLSYDELAKRNVAKLISYASDYLYLRKEDRIYTENALLELLKLDSPATEESGDCFNVYAYLTDLSGYAVRREIIAEHERARFETKLMGLITPPPSVINDIFNEIARRDGTAEACKFLNYVSQASTYLRMPDIDKNISWTHENERGNIIVTINRSKPEKTPEEVKRAKEAKTGYPKCVLCAENSGFAGNDALPARQTIRTIPLTLGGEEWFLQFSPYAYFEEHVIAVSREHRPMNVDAASFCRMLDFISKFPHYFIGSNAALPIVGGSILAHDHYQGGKKVLPVFDRPARKRYLSQNFPDVNISIVDWYNSIVRLESRNVKQLAAAAERVRSLWADYSDESAGIIPFSEENGERVQHNAITPICSVNKDTECEFDMVLRNNRTDAAHPFGIFHPAEELHNIKQESIGIIEVMGLFILPVRLKEETEEIKKILTGETPLNFEALANDANPLHRHLGMIAQLVADNGVKMRENAAQKAVTDYINSACEKILDTTAVFKNTNEGQSSFDKFVSLI